jgi:hypothetical protein
MMRGLSDRTCIRSTADQRTPVWIDPAHDVVIVRIGYYRGQRQAAARSSAIGLRRLLAR